MVNNRKGLILAGGSGSRLYPITVVTNKQLLHIYNKPMVYYAMTALMLADIREVMIISSPDRIELFKTLFASIDRLGVDVHYGVQEAPNGIAEAFLIAQDFLDNSPCALVLGDNLFDGDGLSELLVKASQKTKHSSLFATEVENPSAYGVIEFDKYHRILSIEEKPTKPKSSHIVTGLYFYDESVVDKTRNLKPSARGELEITDLNNLYLNEGKLSVNFLGQNISWFDSGTYDGLMNSSSYVATRELMTAKMIGCIEQTAFEKGWVSEKDAVGLIQKLPQGEYRYQLEMAWQRIYRDDIKT